MKKIIFSLVVLLSSIAAKAQCDVYTLVKPDCASITVGGGHLFNVGIGDYDFSHDYFVGAFEIGKYFNQTVGLSFDFSIAESSKDVDTRLYNIGLMLNTRLTNYYANSPIDLVLNFGAGYGRFDFSEHWVDSEGVNYFVPKVSLDIVFNLSSDKVYQFAITPSYQYFIHSEEKYYYDDGSKVKSDISLIGITGKFRVNF